MIKGRCFLGQASSPLFLCPFSFLDYIYKYPWVKEYTNNILVLNGYLISIQQSQPPMSSSFALTNVPNIISSTFSKGNDFEPDCFRTCIGGSILVENSQRAAVPARWTKRHLKPEGPTRLGSAGVSSSPNPALSSSNMETYGFHQSWLCIRLPSLWNLLESS